MYTALDVMTTSPAGIAAIAVLLATIILTIGLATWLFVKSKHGPETKTTVGES